MQALVVEDDPGLRLIYRRVLEDIGFTVIEAENGAIALEILGVTVPDIVFLDMLLPEVSGVTVLNHLTTTPAYDKTLTIIVSSNKQFERVLRPDSPVHFVLKPIRPAQIRELALSVMQP